MLRVRYARARPPVHRLHPHQPHEPPDPVPARGDALAAQMRASAAAFRRTGTACAVHPCAASGPSSPRSPPSAGSTATTGSLPGARTASTGSAVPRPDHPVPSGSAPEPAPKNIPLDRQLPDLGVKVPDLLLVLLRELPARAPGEHLREPIEHLPVPCAYLVRIKPMARGDRLHRVPLPQRLQRHPRLELHREPLSLPGHLRASCSILESTLTTCPKNPGTTSLAGSATNFRYRPSGPSAGVSSSRFRVLLPASGFPRSVSRRRNSPVRSSRSHSSARSRSRHSSSWIVEILVAQPQPQNPLLDQRLDGVLDPIRVARVR